MIEKNEESSEGNESFSRMKFIAARRKILENYFQEMRKNLRARFSELRSSLQSRESQLLRQMEVIYSQQLTLCQRDQETIPTLTLTFADLEILEAQIRSFGKVELNDSLRITGEDPYKVEEYQETHCDHMPLEKAIEDAEIQNPEILKSRSQSNCESEKNLDLEECRSEETRLPKGSEEKTEPKKLEEAHSEQVQQWLEQILRETETEPLVHEVERLLVES